MDRTSLGEGRIFLRREYCTVVPEDDGEGDHTYPEPRKIDIYYRTLFPLNEYLQPRVMLEIGARSLFEPTVNTSIHSLVSTQFPQIDAGLVSTHTMATAAPQKTFLERLFFCMSYSRAKEE